MGGDGAPREEKFPRQEGNMKFPRRQLLRLTVGAVALRAVSRVARAQA